jgi:hypothetical protein
MPRRPLFSKKHLGAWGRFVALFTDSRSWFAVVYMFLQLPLGVFYFSLFTTLVAFGLAGIAHPITQYGFGLPFGHFGHTAYYVPVWLTPFVVLAGVLWILITMHLAKFVGRYHGALAKVMLVRE